MSTDISNSKNKENLLAYLLKQNGTHVNSALEA